MNSIVQTATAAGLIYPIPTNLHMVTDGTVTFAVQVANSLREKKRDTAERRNSTVFLNPFAKIEPKMVVYDLERHKVILNRYNVCKSHLLLITKDFEFQGEALGPSDLRETYRLVRDHHALAAYNSGPESGGSQPHKHIHILPQPLVPGVDTLPMNRFMTGEHGPVVTTDLPFRHTAVLFGPEFEFSEQHVLDAYTRCLAALNPVVTVRSVATDVIRSQYTMSVPTPPSSPSSPTAEDAARCVTGSYNMLLTRDYMLLVPRRREHVDLMGESVSFNAISFTGILFLPASSGKDLLAGLKERGVWESFTGLTFPK